MVLDSFIWKSHENYAIGFFLRNLLKICENFLETSHRVLRISSKAFVFAKEYLWIFNNIVLRIYSKAFVFAKEYLGIFNNI